MKRRPRHYLIDLDLVENVALIVGGIAVSFGAGVITAIVAITRP